VASYKQDIDLLYEDAEEYRTSVYSTLSEQSFVIKKFFISLVSRARNIYYQLNKDSSNWAKGALTPLIHEVKAQKQELQLRLEQLKKTGKSRDGITVQVTALTNEAKELQKQIIDLNNMLKVVTTPILSSKSKKKPETKAQAETEMAAS